MSLTQVDPSTLTVVGPYADLARHVWELAAMSVPFDHENLVFWFVVFFKPETKGFCMNAFDWGTSDEYEDEIKQIMARLMIGCVGVGVVSYKDSDAETVGCEVFTLPDAEKHGIDEQDVLDAYEGLFTQLVEKWEQQN